MSDKEKQEPSVDERKDQDDEFNDKWNRKENSKASGARKIAEQCGLTDDEAKALFGG